MIDNSPGNPDLQKILSGLVEGAEKEEKSEPGPGDAAPTTQTKSNPLVTMQMDEEEVARWWKRIKASDERIDRLATEWDQLLNEYKPLVSPTGSAEDVKVPKHFRNVHSKIGMLFYQVPDPILTPKSPSPSDNAQPNPLALLNPMAPEIKQEDIIVVKQAVLQAKLGRDGINYGRLMDELLFDTLAWAGIGCSKIGYNCITKTIQKPVMVPDPTFVPPPPQPGNILGLMMPPKPPQIPLTDPVTQTPVTEPEDVPVFEEWYERRFSPKKLITNFDLRSTRHDQDATFLGMHFYISKDRAKKSFSSPEFPITDEDVAKGTSDERMHKHKSDDGLEKDTDLVHGVELWMKACYFSDEVHPEVIYQLILLEGMKRPVCYRLSPDQTIGEDGRLTPDSLIGFPIEVMTIRDFADSAFPASDSAFTNNEIKQLNTYRRQGVELREAAIGHYLYDSDAFDDTTLQLLKSHKVGRYVPVASGGLKNTGSKGIFDTTAQVHRGVDDARMEANFSKDIDETLGIGSVQAGAMEDTIHTATEVATVQTAVAGRNGKEKNRVVDKYLSSCRKLDQLLMRYATETDYVTITGEDGARRMMAWNNQVISGRYLYDISPDSQLSPDMARDRKSLLEYYNLTANDPLSNRIYTLRRLARMYGLDPIKAVNPIPMLPPGVMAPGGPAGPGAAPVPGVATSPVAQPPHGGPATPGAPVNKHSATTSGKRPNEPGAEPAR